MRSFKDRHALGLVLATGLLIGTILAGVIMSETYAFDRGAQLGDPQSFTTPSTSVRPSQAAETPVRPS